MTFRTIDLQPLSSEQTSKLAALFDRNLTLRPRKGLYHSLDTKVGAVFDVVFRNFFLYVGIPLAMKMEGRAATFCLVDRLALRDPRDVDVSFYYDVIPSQIVRFEEGLRKAIAFSLQFFFGNYDEALLLRDCLWNFTKVHFEPTQFSLGGTMYLYSFGPEKHRCLDVRVCLGNFRSWVTLLDSFSIDLLTNPVGAGSLELPLKEAIKKIEKREIGAIRPLEVNFSGFERYLCAHLEGFLDHEKEATLHFLSKFPTIEALFVGLKKFLNLHHSEKSDDYFITYYFQAALTLNLLKIPFNNELLQNAIEEFKPANKHLCYFQRFVGKVGFYSLISPYLLIISLLDEKGKRLYLESSVYSLFLSNYYLHIPSVCPQEAVRYLSGLDNEVIQDPLFKDILAQLVKLSLENRQFLVDESFINSVIKSALLVSPALAWFIYDQFSKEEIPQDLLIRLHEVYKSDHLFYKERFINQIKTLPLKDFKKIASSPEGLAFISDLIENEVIGNSSLFYFSICKWIEFFSKGEIKGGYLKIIDLIKSLPDPLNLLEVQKALYIEEMKETQDASDLFILLVNTKVLVDILHNKAINTALLARMICRDKSIGSIKNCHIKYLFSHLELLDTKKLLAPYRLITQSALKDSHQLVSDKPVALLPISKTSCYQLIIDTSSFEEALKVFKDYSINPSQSGLVWPVLERVRYLLEKNVPKYDSLETLADAFHIFSECKHFQIELFGWKLLALFNEIIPPRRWIERLAILGRRLEQPSQKSAFFNKMLLTLSPLLGPLVIEKFQKQFEDNPNIFSFQLSFLSYLLLDKFSCPDFSLCTKEAIDIFSLLLSFSSNQTLAFEKFKEVFPYLLVKESLKPLLPVISQIAKNFDVEELQPYLNVYFNQLFDEKKVPAPSEVGDLLDLFHKNMNPSSNLALYRLIIPWVRSDTLKECTLKAASLLLTSSLVKERQEGALLIAKGFKEYLFDAPTFLSKENQGLIPLCLANLTDFAQKNSFSRSLLDFLEANFFVNIEEEAFVSLLGIANQEDLKCWSFYFRKKNNIKALIRAQEDFVERQLSYNKIIKVFNFLVQEWQTSLIQNEKDAQKSLVERISLHPFHRPLLSCDIEKIETIYQALKPFEKDFIVPIRFIENEGLGLIELAIGRNTALFFEHLAFLIKVYRHSLSHNESFYKEHLLSKIALKKSKKLHVLKEDIEEFFGSKVSNYLFEKIEVNQFPLNPSAIEPENPSSNHIKVALAGFGFFCFIYLIHKASYNYKT
jgi:hypothetical protein